MPSKSIPMPEDYIVWRDNQNKYHVAKRPADLHPPMPSRTRAVQWLWGEFGRKFTDRLPSSGRHDLPEVAPTPTVWHFEKENNHGDAERE